MPVVTLRDVVSDDDLDTWRQIRLAIMPYERAATVAELRGMERPGRHLILAELDGVAVGHGLVDRSDLAGRGGLAARVLPAYRRRGIGDAIVRALAPRLVEQGHTIVAGHIDDHESLGFALRYGFTEVDRQVEQVRRIGEEPRPEVPGELRVVTIAERPELWDRAYHELAVEALKDMALTSPIVVTLDQWQRDWINTPEATFLALTADDEIVGLASVHLDEDRPERAEQGFTAVRRDWRGRQVASMLKRTTLWWAAEHGLEEIYTWTQQGNADMRRVNEGLGFTYGLVSIRVEAALPLALP